MVQEKRIVKVVHIIGGMHFGGAERVVANLADRTDPKLFDVSICVVKLRGAMADELVRKGQVIIGPAIEGGGGPFLGPRATKSLIDELQPDVIHTHGTIAILNTAPWYFFTRQPDWIHTFHFGNYPHVKRRYLWLERIASRLPNCLVAVSDQQRQTVIRTHWIKEHRIRTIRNGVEDDPYSESLGEHFEVRDELGIPRAVPVVGAVAVLSNQKGLTYLLEAMVTVLESHPNVHLIIVGSGPLESELRRKIEISGLGEKVLITGWRKDARRLMKAFDIFALPSLWEGLPVVLLEAMAAGLPAVCSDVGDNARVISDGKSGIIVPAADSNALASALLRLLDDSALARSMGKNARRAYLTQFDVAHMVEAYEKIYLELQNRIAVSSDNS